MVEEHRCRRRVEPERGKEMRLDSAGPEERRRAKKCEGEVGQGKVAGDEENQLAEGGGVYRGG